MAQKIAIDTPVYDGAAQSLHARVDSFAADTGAVPESGSRLRALEGYHGRAADITAMLHIYRQFLKTASAGITDRGVLFSLVDESLSKGAEGLPGR